jgi:uncharacterized membrane protein YraQ (UPF0718 family)
MDYMFLAVAILAGFHGYTFSQWLWKNENTVGAIGVFLLIMVCNALPLFRIMTNR